MAILSSHGKGQAAALDLAVFVSICILALSYLFIQSLRSSSETGFVQENENINEVAIKAMESLVQSSGADMELTTIQPIAMRRQDSCISQDMRTIMGYVDKAVSLLDEAESALGTNAVGADAIENSPYIVYIRERLSDVESYISSSGDIVAGLIDETIDGMGPEAQTVCDALSSLASLFPGYEDLAGSCGDIAGSLIDGLMANITDSEGLVSSFLDEFYSGMAGIGGDELKQKLHEIRCALEAIRENANYVLSYLETGMSTDVSFIELVPVKANFRDFTLGRLISDSVSVGANLASTDNMRFVAGSAGLMLLRNSSIGSDIMDISFLGKGEVSETETSGREEYVSMIPKSPLLPDGNSSASGPYGQMLFGAESYITGAGSLALRLSFSGDELGGKKQKTNYFEKFDYIWNSSAYPGNTHKRSYNGSFVKGVVREGRISKKESTRIENAPESRGINGSLSIRERIITRPMDAIVHLQYENKSFQEQSYSFDLIHHCVDTNASYKINTSTNCENNENEFVPVVLGFIYGARLDMRSELEKMIRERLDELLDAYNYSFEVWDCCNRIIDINGDTPEGRAGRAEYYFNADGRRGVMKLTVWR